MGLTRRKITAVYKKPQERRTRMKQKNQNCRPTVGRGGSQEVTATRPAEKGKMPQKKKGGDLRCGK